jgi:hypothetical protein
MRKLLVLFLLIGFLCMSFKISETHASEVDILLQKLVEKGVLTPGEALVIKTETQEQVKREIAEGKSSSLPQWVQNTKIKGDLRARYQKKYEEPVGADKKNTDIGRVRMRLGLESKVNEKILAGIGIASGSGDPRSTNVSFGGYNSKKTITLDYAYAKYYASSLLNLVAGKMLLNDVIWEPTDLIWDTDITPEGAVIQLNKAFSPKTSFFMNSGVLLVETGSSTDEAPPMAYLIQPGIDHKFNDRFSLKAAFSYQGFDNIKGHKSSGNSGAANEGNAKAGTSLYVNNYPMINPALELTITKPFESIGLNIDSLKLFGEYVDNLDVSDKSTGYSFGFQAGHAKVEKFGDRQFRYVYATLDRDAVLDVLPDSDRYGGKTDMRSHEASINFGIGKNTSLGLDVYRSQKFGDKDDPETLVQIDWNKKF